MLENAYSRPFSEGFFVGLTDLTPKRSRILLRPQMTATETTHWLILWDPATWKRHYWKETRYRTTRLVISVSD